MSLSIIHVHEIYINFYIIILRHIEYRMFFLEIFSQVNISLSMKHLFESSAFTHSEYPFASRSNRFQSSDEVICDRCPRKYRERKNVEERAEVSLC